MNDIADFMAQIGQDIAKARERRNMTQTELAKKNMEEATVNG